MVEYLVQKGFTHYSVRAEITKEIEKRGLPISRETMNRVANDLRKTHGPDYFDKVIFAKIERERVTDAVVESIRVLAGAENFKKHGGILFAVDADRKLRYERAVLRNSATDHVSFEEFCAQEDQEMNQTEPWDMNVFGVMKISDYVFQNNGTLEELHAQIDAALAKITK